MQQTDCNFQLAGKFIKQSRRDAEEKLQEARSVLRKYLECPYLLLYQLRSEEKAAGETVEDATFEHDHIPECLRNYDQPKWNSLRHLIPRQRYDANSDDQTLLKAFLEAGKAPSMPESGASSEELAKWRSFCSNPGIDGVGEQPLLIAPHVAFRFVGRRDRKLVGRSHVRALFAGEGLFRLSK